MKSNSDLWTLAAFACLAAAIPARGLASEDKTRVVIMSFAAEGYTEGEVRLIEQRVAEKFAPYAQVLSSQDVASMLDHETQKQRMACVDDGCLAELAGSLGARFLISGTLGQLGGRQRISLVLIDADQARAIERAGAEGNSSSELVEGVDQAAETLVAALTQQTGAGGPGAVLIAGAVAAGLGALVSLAAGGGALWTNSQVGNTSLSPERRLEQQGLGQALVLGAAAGGLVALVGAVLVVVDLISAQDSA